MLRLEVRARARRRGRGLAARCASCRPAASATRGSSGARAAAGRGRRARARSPSAGRSSFDGEAADRRAGCGCAPSCSARLARVKLCVHNTTELEGDRRASTATRRCCHSLISTHVCSRSTDGRFVSPLESDGPRAEAVRGLRDRQHLAGARLAGGRRRARRGDVPPRPSRARAREPRQPLRQHRDRGGAAAPRADAVRGRAGGDRRPGPEGAGDDRARRAGDPGGDAGPARAAGAGTPAVRRARGDASTASDDHGAGRRRSSCGRARTGGDVYDKILAGRTATIERIYIDYDDGSTSGSPSTTTRARS